MHSSHSSDNHGDTSLDHKIINLFHNGNIQVLKETLLHEIEHVLMEDILKSTSGISDIDEREEAMIRLVNPRRMLCTSDNKELFAWIYGLDKAEVKE